MESERTNKTQRPGEVPHGPPPAQPDGDCLTARSYEALEAGPQRRTARFHPASSREFGELAQVKIEDLKSRKDGLP